MYCEYWEEEIQELLEKGFNRALCIVNIIEFANNKRKLGVLIEHYVLWILQISAYGMLYIVF